MPLDMILDLSAPVALAPVLLDTRVTLYLGRGIPAQFQRTYGGNKVSDRAVGHFMAETVVRYLPQGFTVVEAQGGWADALTGRPVAEDTLVIQAVVNWEAQAQDIRMIARHWKDYHFQDAVMVTSEPITVSFI